MKAILLVAGLLGACNFAAADLASDTLLKISMENYLRNQLAFPESGFDIIAAAQPLPQEQIRKVIEPEPQTELMRGGTWQALQPIPYNGVERRNGGEERNGPALWWLISSTVICLAFGCCLSAAGSRTKTCRQRRRVKTTIRMMASCY